MRSTTNILASCLGDSEAQGLRTSDHSQSFHHYEIETGTHWDLLFHALSYVSYHTWLQVLSICCYLLSWYVWTFPWDPIKCLPGCFIRTSYLKVRNPSLLLQGHTSQQTCMLLPSCSNQKPGNVLSHSFLLYVIHQNVSSAFEIAQSNSLSISIATGTVQTITVSPYLLSPLFLFWPFQCFL